jgi:energy-converting hydrogenase Eha subunit F
MTRLVYAAAAVLVILGLSIGSVIAQAKYVAPIKGEAEIQLIQPKADPDHKANIVRTTIQLKNNSPTGSIAGLKVIQYWWDKANSPQPVMSASQRLRKPLQPGEEATMTLECPLDPKMFRDSYQFEHANGKIKAKVVKKF